MYVFFSFRRLGYQLNVTGGDGFYQWSTSDTRVAYVTGDGVLGALGIGRTQVTAAMRNNSAIRTSAGVVVASPSDLKIVYSLTESEVGSPNYLVVSLFYSSGSTARSSRFTNCTSFPFQINIDNGDFFHISGSRMKTPSDACTTIGVIGNRAGKATVTVSYLSNGVLLKDKVVVSAYEPLKISSPESGQTVLAVGAQRYLVFTGGPSLKNSDGRSVETSYDDSIVTATHIHDGVAESERIYMVTCRTLGSTNVTLTVDGASEFENTAARTVGVRVICAHPRSVRLHSEMVNTEERKCRQAFKSKNLALNSRPITLKVVVADEDGNVFDNATSLEMRWHLSDAELGDVRFPGVVRLREEDKLSHRLPLYHYQTIAPARRAGQLKVTARTSGYRKSWFRQLGFGWEEKAAAVAFDLEETIALTLVNNIHVSPEAVSVFNHPKNVAKLYVTYGSGFYGFSSTAGEAAVITYAETTKSIDIEPVLPDSFTVTVKDECLDSDPVSVSVSVLTISKINVDVTDKIEKGRTVTAYLKLLDSAGNSVTDRKLLNLRTEVDSTILAVDCANSSARFDDRIACSVTGRELGVTNLVFKAGSENSAILSSPVRLQVYPPLQIIPRNVTMLPGAILQLTVKGGPQPDCLIEFSTESDVLFVDSAGNVVGNEIGDGIVTARASGIRADGEKIEYSYDSVRVSVVYLEGIRIKTPLTKLRTGATMPVWVEGIPEQIGPLVLASVQPSLTFKWDVSSANLAVVYNIFDEIGVKVNVE